MRERWQNKIRYLLVDEYQDTNTSQYELVKLLRVSGRATVVGDDDQSTILARRAAAEPGAAQPGLPGAAGDQAWTELRPLGVF